MDICEGPEKAMEHDPENCKRLAALLSEYLDFELPPDACAEIEKHLADCPPCILFVDSLRKTLDLCRKYEPGEMPPPLTAAARADLEQAWRRTLSGMRRT